MSNKKEQLVTVIRKPRISVDIDEDVRRGILLEWWLKDGEWGGEKKTVRQMADMLGCEISEIEAEMRQVRKSLATMFTDSKSIKYVVARILKIVEIDAKEHKAEIDRLMELMKQEFSRCPSKLKTFFADRILSCIRLKNEVNEKLLKIVSKVIYRVPTDRPRKEIGAVSYTSLIQEISQKSVSSGGTVGVIDAEFTEENTSPSTTKEKRNAD